MTLRRRTIAGALLPLFVACGASQATDPAPSAHGPRCMSSAQSIESGGAERAPAPFADCAAQLDMHCAGEDRYALCSYPLDAARTERARANAADLCCFGPEE